MRGSLLFYAAYFRPVLVPCYSTLCFLQLVHNSLDTPLIPMRFVRGGVDLDKDNRAGSSSSPRRWCITRQCSHYRKHQPHRPSIGCCVGIEAELHYCTLSSLLYNGRLAARKELLAKIRHRRLTWLSKDTHQPRLDALDIGWQCGASVWRSLENSVACL